MYRQSALSIVVLLTAVAVFFVSGSSLKAQEETTSSTPDLTADECLSAIDPYTGAQTNPDCPSPESEHTSITAVIANLLKLDPSCPAPTKSQGSQCVLNGDVILDATLDVTSGTHLNCKGHRLSPTTPGVPLLGTPSEPEVAILLNEAYSVTIQNCIIGDATKAFDFGIVIAKSKIPPDQADDFKAVGLLSNKVLDNEIRTRAAGVEVLEADYTHISGNTFESIGGCSQGIVVQYDSDRNLITDNTLIGSSGTSGGPTRAFPGTDDQILPCFSTPIFLSGAIGPYPLVNARVGNELIQLRNVPNIGDTGQTDLSSDGNVIESNAITQVGSSTGKAGHTGIFLAHDAINTLIENNIVSGGLRGISGGGDTFSMTIPGTCTLDSSRYCLSDADCFISGVDTTPEGTCTGVNSMTARRTSRGTKIDDNQLTGSFNDRAIQLVGQIESTVIGNTIAATAPIGLAISNEMLETGIVQRNVVDGPVTALRLARGVANFFGAMVSLNDFTGYMNAVLVGDGYPFPTFLSANERGNYWGLSCEAGGFDQTKVSQDNGSPPQVVVEDDHPYAEPVAGTPDELLPLTCR
jgi:Right handed beta helix region